MYKICVIGQNTAIRTVVHNVIHQYASRVSAACYVSAIHCQTCHSLQTRPLHTTFSVAGSRAGKTKKKIVKGVTFKKSVKSSWATATIYPDMTVAELAATLNKDIDDVFEALFYIPNTDLYDKPDSVIVDLNVIKQVCDKLGHRWKVEGRKKKIARENKDVTRRPPPDPADCVKRPPVVTIMGHVDHGKTTLLDAMRKSNIVDKEFGGITQHIGAFSVRLKSGETITFIDTPGHAAFSSMRARGAQITDIVVLVVAADDGVMKQTMESYKHAQEAGVPIIVAINKIDKHDADVEQTKDILLRHGIALEEHGGDIQAVPISALKGTNLDMLQEAIIALAELLEIKCDPTGPAEGAIIEAKTDPGKGRVATVLIQRGTLNKGACLVAGTSWAKVRSMHDDNGCVMKKVPPGVAAELTGWKDLPSAGDIVIEVKSESQAREVVSWRLEEEQLQKQQEELNIILQKQQEHRQEYEELRREKLEKGIRRGTIYSRRTDIAEDTDMKSTPELSIVLKGDVHGTVEAILQLLNTYNCPHCQLNLLQYGVGAVSEQDIDMVESFGGVVYAFNVEVPSSIAKMANEKSIKIYKHNVIYKLIDDLKEHLQERVLPVQHHEVIGEAIVQEKFTVTVDKKKMFVAGCRCLKGTLLKEKLYKLVRDGETLLEGQPLASLRHFKAEVSEIKEKQECGLMFQDQNIDPQPGDKVICYEPTSVVPTIEWQLDF